MKFIPCNSDLCTKDGTHCAGCGRSHEEIAETKALVNGLVDLSQKQDYENVEDFAAFIHKNLLKKLQNPS